MISVILLGLITLIFFREKVSKELVLSIGIILMALIPAWFHDQRSIRIK